MSKRFVDTELWQKEWFQSLSLRHKILVKYIFENCDCAGVWNGNFRMASFIIGETLTIDDLKEINNFKNQFEILENGNIFVSDFIKFQYGTLSENCKPHKPVIEKLKKYNLFERVFKGYSKGIETLEEKEKEKEQYKEKEKEKENINPDFYFSDSKQKVFEIYKQTCTNLIALSFEPRNKRILDKVNSYLKEINNNFEQYKLLCEKANHLQKIADTKIDFEMMLNCYIGIMNGKYEIKSGTATERKYAAIEEIVARKRMEEKGVTSG